MIIETNNYTHADMLSQRKKWLIMQQYMGTVCWMNMGIARMSQMSTGRGCNMVAILYAVAAFSEL